MGRGGGIGGRPNKNGVEGCGTGGGAGGGGAGTQATPGDATWIWRFYQTSQQWKAPGATGTGTDPDFISTVSGTAIVGSEYQAFTWASTPRLVADVQGWLSNP